MKKQNYITISTYLSWRIQPLWFVMWWVGIAQVSWAQESWHLQWVTSPSDSLILLENKLTPPSEFADNRAVYTFLNDAVGQLVASGYLEASVDTLWQQDSVFTALLHVGNVYQWVALSAGNVPSNILQKIRFREKIFQKHPFRPADLRTLQERLLAYAENNGYPFARVKLVDVEINQQQIKAALDFSPEQRITYAGISMTGSATISELYLTNYLGIQPGEVYKKSDILSISKKLRELPFLQETKSSIVSFYGSEATINLFIDKKKASRFDFLVGVLPGQQETQNGVVVQRVVLTGEINAEFQNQFGKGERFAAEIERLRPGIQELNLSVNYPYLLGLPFGLDAELTQYRRDTAYNDVGMGLGVRYLMQGGSYGKAFWQRMQTNLLQVDLENILQTKRLPSNLDINTIGYGLEYQLQRLDYRFNPRQGWHLLLRGSANTRTIKINETIADLQDEENPNFDYGSLYDTLQLKSLQFRIQGKVARYFALPGNTAIKAQIDGGYLLSKAPLYQNEQFRLGGNRQLRGFDEESIFATFYVINTVEYRLLTGQNSYFYLFADYAYLQDMTQNTQAVNQPFGFGGGLTFDTAAGVFGLSLAVGRQQGNPIDFRNPKVHFGYVSLF